MSFVDIMSFVGGAADRAREYDKAETERAQRLAEIKSKRQDELLKTRWSEAKKKRDKDVERYEGFIDKGGDITSLQTQAYLLNYDDVASMQKDIIKTKKAGGTFSWADAPVMPPELEAIKYSDEDAIYKSLLKTQGTTAGQIVEALGGPAREKREVELTDEQLGSVSTYRRADPTPLTEEQKKTLSGYEFKAEPEDEKEWQFKFRKHTENKEKIIELYKGKEDTDEAKQAFAQIAQDERTLIYGKDGGTSDWQRRFNLHMLDTPKREDYETEAQFDSAMKTWKHGYNTLKLGANYKDVATSAKDQVVGAFDAAGNKIKVIKTGDDNDIFNGIPGWKQFGGAEKKSDEASVAAQKWAPIQVIVDAIKEGRTVTQAQLDAAEFITRMTKDAIPLEYHKVLDTWNLSTMKVRDFSHLPIVVGGETVPATTANIKAAAAEHNKTVDEYRQELYDYSQETE